MTAANLVQGFIDHSGERSRTEYYIQTDAGPIWSSSQSAIADAVHDGMAAVTLCNLTTLSVKLLANNDIPVIPTDENAQRELDLVVQYVSDTDPVPGVFYDLHIPGPDLTLLAQANTDEVDIASNVTALALIAVLEGYLIVPDGSFNSIVVTRMFIRGRRN